MKLRPQRAALHLPRSERAAPGGGGSQAGGGCGGGCGERDGDGGAAAGLGLEEVVVRFFRGAHIQHARAGAGERACDACERRRRSESNVLEFEYKM